jgi:hypothetical protein
MSLNIRMVMCCTLPQRSAIIKLCQAKTIPWNYQSALGRILREVEPVMYQLPTTLRDNYRSPRKQPMSFLKFVQDLEGIDSPLIAAILLDVCRALPLTGREIKEAQYKGWSKEISVMEQNPPGSSFRWSVIFNRYLNKEPLHQDFFPNPYINTFLYNRFFEWRERMSTRIHYPRTSTKSMSRSTVRNYENYTNRERGPHATDFSQEDYLRHYHAFGQLLGGACELRQRWYRSGAKPRTYIAQGGHSYSVAKCTQDFWTELVNSNPVTNHITRLQPDRLRLRPESRLRIYDLETFTSRYHEQRHFLDELSRFCRGFPFTYLDVRHGLITTDMGILISEYNEECNKRTPISFERVPSLAKHPIAAHHFASALGIYGNLMTCTLPHGCVMMQLVEHEDQVNVAGDDGAVDENDENEDLIDIAINAQGRYEQTKSFDTRDEGVICLKRDLVQQGQSVVHGILIIPPSVMSIAELVFGYTDPRYRSDTEALPMERIRRVGRELFRFIRSVHRARDALSILEKREALSILSRISGLWNVNEATGSMQICGDRYSWPALPIVMSGEVIPSEVVDQYFETDPLIYTAGQCYKGFASYALTGKLPYRATFENSRVNESFEANSSPILRIWEMLGYVEKKPLLTYVTGDVGLLRVQGRLFSVEPKLYTYTVLRDVPIQLVV